MYFQINQENNIWILCSWFFWILFTSQQKMNITQLISNELIFIFHLPGLVGTSVV